jgi:hypothetical protein
MPTAVSQKPRSAPAVRGAVNFCRANAGSVLLASLLMLIPCFWHRHIEAGDLASHTYNGWLAELVARGQAPGVYVVSQWDNVLFDISVAHLGNLVGLAAAEKIVVSVAVLIFFWGAFSFLAVVTGKPPWLFAPCIAMLAFGYAFSMGFLNYYLSVGLACFALAIVWPAIFGDAGVANWIYGAPVAALALIAHPIGFLWFLSTIAYVSLWRRTSGAWRIALPALAAAALTGLHSYIARHASFRASWREDPFYLRNGADQLIFYGHRYAMIAYAAIAWGVLCFVVELFFHVGEGDSGGEIG